jgi:nucleotide-binding universal stress UspA family protein
MVSGRVVVGFAPTAAGYQALRLAVDLAGQRVARLVAVRAVAFDEPWADGGFRLTVAVTGDLAIAFREALGRVPAGLEVQVAVHPGPFDQALSAIADRPDDIVVVGGCTRRRLAGLSHAAMLRRLLRGAVCPVVVAPPPAMARQGSATRLGREAVAEVERFLRQPAGLPG